MQSVLTGPKLTISSMIRPSKIRYMATMILFLLYGPALFAQEQRGLCIIENIHDLESNKDPKCHATASRLEDFMYGTPLNDKARSKKIELQKKLVLYVWNSASEMALNNEKDSIDIEILEEVFQNLNAFGKINDKWYVQTRGKKIYIKANDLRQYASVAYALRAMLSVEQDFLFNPSWELIPLEKTAVDGIKLYLDLVTLATLKLSDQEARKDNVYYIDDVLFSNSWDTVLKNSKEEIYLKSSYPKAVKQDSGLDPYFTIRSIIDQKIASYKAYNNISLPIFLRNIQVFFARHKWPVGQDESDALKSYLIESLVQFTSQLLKDAHKLAIKDGSALIRIEHLNSLIPRYLPFETNKFEDIIYFPASENKITIESYDLDAFRDSGIHWLILDYALDDLEHQKLIEPDPFAAELIVETSAQMALLVLRITGDQSISNNHPYIHMDDMDSAFLIIQDMINAYPDDLNKTNRDETRILSSSSDTSAEDQAVFKEATQELGIDFMHKSSDWLSRLIRSYVVLEDENLARMAIPPAFGGSGVAAEDINNDGWDDIILLGGMGLHLYINEKGKAFQEKSKDYGLSLWNDHKNSYSEPRQIIVADLDNDGWQDIFISLVNDKHKLYKNINGTYFKDLSERIELGGVNEVAGPATVLDYDNDGDLDLYIAYFGNYLKGQLPSLDRNNQNGSINKLYSNEGDFMFKERVHMYPDDIDYGWSQALGHSDLDQDGWQDIIVGNDFGINAYYINQKNGYFKNKCKELKTNKPSYTMNVGSTDLNGDMFPDLYISNIVVMEKDEKYVNPTGITKMNFDLEKMENIRTVEANDLFISQIGKEGLDHFTLSKSVGRGFSSTGWSWDADFFDYDNDGDDDLYCLNGMNDFRVYSAENPYYRSPDGEKIDIFLAQSNKEKNNFFVNDSGQLNDRSAIIGAGLVSNSRSAAFLDHDNDGDLDIVVNNYHDKAVYLKNDLINDNNWIKIKLVGSPENKINRDAIGCNIIVDLKTDERKIWREIKSTTGYLSVHPKNQHFGLGAIKLVDILVQWTNGERLEFKNIQVNKSYIIDYKNGLSELKL